jgi:hypothetical protein
MFKWIATTTVALTLLTGTALMAGAAEWTVIGDGYVPVSSSVEAEAPETLPAARAQTPWLGVEDGYVFPRPGQALAEQAPPPSQPPACCGSGCAGMHSGDHVVVGDGYAPAPDCPMGMPC